jgi:hypothetical protein
MKMRVQNARSDHNRRIAGLLYIPQSIINSLFRQLLPRQVASCASSWILTWDAINSADAGLHEKASGVVFYICRKHLSRDGQRLPVTDSAAARQSYWLLRVLERLQHVKRAVHHCASRPIVKK